jgi:hypothetical protein
MSVQGGLQRFDRCGANGWFRRVSPVVAYSGDRLLSEPTAGTQPSRWELFFMLRVFGRLPFTDSA